GCPLQLVARTVADLEAACAELTAKYPVPVRIHALDLADSASVATLAGACGEVEILINNAGAIPAGALGIVSEDAWRSAWDLKVFGYINLCRALYPGMAGRRRGVIINVVGIAGGE